MIVCFALIFGACATSPLGRKQLIIVSDAQMDQMGTQAFDQMKSSTKVETDPKINQYVHCVVDGLMKGAADQVSTQNWDVVVFRDPQVNAFALPGGKVGVYTGLLKVAQDQGQLAAVIGHEIGHVIAKHGAERVSEQAGTELGLAALGAIVGDNPNKKTLMGLLGLGAQVGVALPFSRTQESEADLIGLNLMAESGFNPDQAIQLWRNMSASGGAQPPEWLSDHPANEKRMEKLQEHLPDAEGKYKAARGAGKSPQCVSPRLK